VGSSIIKELKDLVMEHHHHFITEAHTAIAHVLLLLLLEAVRANGGR
jgi:hypothetical protein